MKYVVTRIARDNPDMKGRRLYLTNTGLWSLYLGHALRFASEAEAEAASDLWTKIEAVPS